MSGIRHEPKIPSSKPSFLHQIDLCGGEILTARTTLQSKQTRLSHAETPRLPHYKRCSSAPDQAMSTKKESSTCHHELGKNRSGTVTGCSSASFRAVPLHGIVTLSNRSYHYTNLYACRQIAFWIKAKSSPKQCSTSQTRCRRSLSFGSSTRSAIPDTNLTARYYIPDHALYPLPPCISHTNVQTTSEHLRLDMLHGARTRRLVASN